MQNENDELEKTSMYYGVYIPADVETEENESESLRVFEKTEDALKWVKIYKKSRFKCFHSYEDAVHFSMYGSEGPTSTKADDKIIDSPTVGEKPSQFRGPSSQNLVKLRKAIEEGHIDFVHTTIWVNPRYLIGVGDTPSILQEGFRYNGLHVAAKAKNASMCYLILNTISNIAFIKRFFVDDWNPEDRANILLDLYLNTPDKGLNETPLHFAVKYGAVECVEALLSFQQCDKSLRNKHGKLPREIICDRYTGPEAHRLSASISALLEESFYVPVLRSDDNCVPAVIGEPFSPKSPPTFNEDPMSPRMQIHAYAGPMDKTNADQFRKIWKTPPRTLQLGSPRPKSAEPAAAANNSPSSTNNLAALRYKDPEKGLERFGNSLAHRMEVEWNEYWPFLDCFIDLASDEGLNMFESYLASRTAAAYNSYSGDELLDPHETPPFRVAKSIVDDGLNGISPMTDLCNALQACTLHDTASEKVNNNLNSLATTDELSPLLCIDKSLQVFAKRFSNTIKCLLMTDSLECTVLEMHSKGLRQLMVSYMNDARFLSIDVHLVHHRLAYLTKSMLTEDVQDLGILEKILDFWLESFSKNYDCFSSDDEGVQGTVTVHGKSQHTTCILKGIQEFLNNDVRYADVKTEAQCEDVWKESKVCSCSWKDKTSRKIYGARSKNHLNRLNSWAQEQGKHCLTNNKMSEDAKDLEVDSLNDYSSEEDNELEQYFTPPVSPSLIDSFELLNEDDSEDENDEFHETHLPDFEVFIEGDIPTKMDYAAFNALKYAEIELTPTKYPNICRWHHAISLFQENERQSWASPLVYRCTVGQPNSATTPGAIKETINSPTSCSTPKSSWLRITGAHSPRLFNSRSSNNVNKKSNRSNLSLVF